MSTQKRKFELFSRLQALGFTYEEAVKLRRVEMTLQRWAEMECGTGTGQTTHSIERDDETGKPFHRVQYPTANGYHDSRYPIADREAGALRWLNGLFKGHPELWFYHQSDPRGCALYVGRKSDVNGSDLDQVYTRGVAVCS